MALTQKDFDQIEELLDEKLEEKIKILPTKEEFFNRIQVLEEASSP